MDDDPRLLAAQGYLELDMPGDARRELEAVEESTKDCSNYLIILLQILMKEESWQESLAVSLLLTKKEPDLPAGYIHTAFCLHELGRTSEAYDVLSSASDDLKKEPVFFYNMACYLAVLGEHDEAQTYLEASFEMNSDLEELAKTDPDLKAFWDAL